MPLDELTVREDPEKREASCAGCGASHRARVSAIRCGDCASATWPKLTIFVHCERCGGDAAVEREYVAHKNQLHTEDKRGKATAWLTSQS